MARNDGTGFARSDRGCRGNRCDQQNADAKEIDAELEKAISDLEAAGADVWIEREPEITLRVEYDLFTTDDPFFELLSKVEKVRSINIVAGRRPRADELTASAMRGL